MIDIHHHLLWGLDDGADTLETTLAMAEASAAEGITHIVATSHANGYWSFQPAAVAEKAAQLRTELAQRNIPITLGTACDFHLSYDNLDDFRLTPRKYTINAGDYLLVELPDHAFPLQLPETFYEMQILGITPILTHPERNPTIQADPKRLIEWLRGGLLIQVTAGSILGNFGKQAERLAHQLLQDNWVHIIATDAHNVSSRPPQAREPYALIEKQFGHVTAERLFVENPLAIFENRPLGEQPEPRHIFEEFEDNRTWWQKLLRR